MNLYQQQLMDHYRNPRNTNKVDSPTFATDQHNPSCGDSISMEGVVKDGILIAVSFKGSGCVISQATASMLTQMCLGKTVHEIMALTKDDVQKLIGIELGPMRLRCALLSLEVLQKGISQSE